MYDTSDDTMSIYERARICFCDIHSSMIRAAVSMTSLVALIASPILSHILSATNKGFSIESSFMLFCIFPSKSDPTSEALV